MLQQDIGLDNELQLKMRMWPASGQSLEGWGEYGHLLIVPKVKDYFSKLRLFVDAAYPPGS